MARATTSRRQETLFIPFLAQGPDGEWMVKVRDGNGSFIILRDGLPKRMAARKMRAIREDMFRTWMQSQREA